LTTLFFIAEKHEREPAPAVAGNGVQKSLTTSERRKVRPHIKWGLYKIHSYSTITFCSPSLTCLCQQQTKFAFFCL